MNYTRLLLKDLIAKNTRSFSKTNLKLAPGSYDGEGKTTVNILNHETDAELMINGISQVGFRLNNNVTVLGSMLIFPKSVLSWTVDNINEVDEEAFSLLTVLEPKIDILVLGIGDRANFSDLHRKLLPFLRKHKFAIEILPTEQACATYNFLTTEGRYAVGALIPPQTLKVTQDDVLQTKLRYQNLYDMD